MSKYILALAFAAFSFTFSYAQEGWRELYDKSYSLVKQGKNAEALKTANEALEKAKSQSGDSSEVSAQTLSLLGDIYFKTGDYSNAVISFTAEKNIRKKLNTETKPPYAKVLNNLSTVLIKLGNYSDAEPLLWESYRIKLAQSAGDSSIAITLQNLGVICQETGRFSEAEKVLLKSIELKKRAFGENSLQFANTAFSLGLLYYKLSNYKNSSEYFEKVYKIYSISYGENSINAVTAGYQLAASYLAENKNIRAEDFLKKLKENESSISKTKSSDYIKSLISIGQIKWTLKKYDDSRKYFEEAKNLTESMFGNGHPDYASCLYNIGTLDFILGDYKSAYDNISTSLKLSERIYSSNFPELATRYHTFAGLLQNSGNFTEADKYYSKAFDLYNLQIKNYFPFLSESEKTKFYSNLKKRFDMFNCYVLSRYEQEPELLSRMLDNRIATKAILLNSNMKIRKQILASNDKTLITLYQQWKSTKEELSKLYRLSNFELKKQSANIDSLETIANRLEKQLSKLSLSFNNSEKESILHWQKVSSVLKDNEAAVEIIQFNYYTKEWTDTSFYVALIIKKESTIPEIVIMKNGNELEEKYISNYHISVRYKIDDKDSYHAYWEKIEKQINGKNVVYVSLDGAYNKVNISSFLKPDGSYVIDGTTIITVSNLSELLENNLKPAKSHNAVLIGDPAYYLGNGQNELLTIKDKNLIPALPGTKNEIEDIAEILSNNKINYKTFMAEKATENVLFGSKNIDILHIATHGFFYENLLLTQDDKILGINTEMAKENPYLRSGLLFAGAQNSLLSQNDSLNKSTNGILTAYDATSLDMDNVNLLVLSACETGLGEIKNGEGVYGLQRAFQIAGAKNIIMSLWKVQDDATQELMTSFYKFWLEGKSIHAAFREAQIEIKNKYTYPYYWGAFIVIGYND